MSEPDAAEGLRRAVEATLAAKSFMIHVRRKDSGASAVTSTMFQAPDRLRAVGNDGSQTIIIGDTMWTQPPAQNAGGTEQALDVLDAAPDGPFVRSPLPTDQPRPLDATFADLRLIAAASEVTVAGDIVRYRSGTGPSGITGAVQIEDGRVAVWTIETSDRTREDSGFITDYDAAAPINPPTLEYPADQPFPQACDPDGRPSRALCDIADLISGQEGATKP